MDLPEILAFSERCIQDEPAWCANDCPLHLDVSALVKHIVAGDFKAGLQLLEKKLIFPEILSYVCDEPCRQLCPRQELGGSIQIRELERSCYIYDQLAPKKKFYRPPKPGKVAVIGGGVTGLACANAMSQRGYAVILYEQAAQVGGSLRSYSTRRLPTEVLERGVSLVSEGLDIRLNTRIESLREIEADALLVAIGQDGRQQEWLQDILAGGIDRNTGESSAPGVFVAGRTRGDFGIATRLAQALTVAHGMERVLQGVSVTLGREREQWQPTTLVIETVDIAIQEPIPASPQGFSREEAMVEAQRCLRCTCAMCAKTCDLMQTKRSLPKRFIGDIGKTLGAISQLTSKANTRVIAACSLCGLCAERCPVSLDMGEIFLESRRLLQEKGDLPPAFYDFWLKDMEFANGEVAFALEPSQSPEYLFFPGCQLAASDPHYVSDTFTALLNLLGEKNVALVHRCCGAPAEWAGLVKQRDLAMRQIVEKWSGLGEPLVVLACPSCLKYFQRYLPQIPVRSLWRIFAEKGLPPQASVNPELGKLELFDPCASRYDQATQQAIRKILNHLGLTYENHYDDGAQARCCGYGGLTYGPDPQLAQTIVEDRVTRSPLDIITYCANCRDIFAAQGKPSFHILDFILGLCDNDGQDRGERRRPAPDISMRRENRRALYDAVTATQDKQEIEQPPWMRLQVNYSVQLADKIQRNLILREDIQRTIYICEANGEQFQDPATGHIFAHLQIHYVTHWVEYSRLGEEYFIYNVYSHRMVIKE
jgi:NADPH-dependent glutamate synthase beta subunit-like oxidoreductase